ncbi:hypothetical protein Acsp03_45730 [Actinomadura sp. NBRC 104412]|uniref:hypothetical protein n=1 Tax=Actinomadura sp. NBRC 104412 TaxID=3032203 RepID=UPI00249FA783|nr:hypothetical protein [Actinomadura sp. NBRC 104412]GLZ07107.1 hypothetical protein Acsp03_45730 [Actinomadura sp. NBRC 104412]
MRRPSPSPSERRRRTPLPRTVAGRVRALTGAVVVALAALIAVTAVTVGNARDGVRVIGHDAGPQVVATGNLYFHLTQMDAQLANALLIGNTADLGMRRSDALARFDQSRLAAGDALLRAAKLADEPTEERTARESLNALARYERLAGQALLLDERAAHRAGPPPGDVIGIYRQATDLMKLDLLPKAYNLTLDNGTLVRTTYESERRAVLAGQFWVIVLGFVALGLLVLLQLFLYRRFRRMLNPALAGVTAATVILLVASSAMLVGQLGHLRTAKADGFDSILALSRARAISTSANADQTRYLLDPGRADTYEQVYLSKSQSVLYRSEGSNVDRYNTAIQRDLADGEIVRTRFLGFLGREAEHNMLPGHLNAFDDVLETYRMFQQSDSRVRQLARAGQRDAAIEARLGGGQSSDRVFAQYDAAMQRLIAIHGRAFDDAVKKGDDGTRGWDVGLPIAGLVLIGLVLAGVRPRLAEYR